MTIELQRPGKFWSLGLFTAPKRLRSHPAAALPPGSALSEPPEGLDLDTAKAALEQVNKRLDAELALRSATETRALTLAGQCTTLLSVIAAATLAEFFGSHRPPLIAAGIAGGLCLFVAVLFAYSSANPRLSGVLPGRLPDELWTDLVAPDMRGPEFIGRLMIGLQDAMVQNEFNQDVRARSLSRAIGSFRAAVPLAVFAALVAGLYTARPSPPTTVQQPTVGSVTPAQPPPSAALP